MAARLMRIIVSGWRRADADTHGSIISDALTVGRGLVWMARGEPATLPLVLVHGAQAGVDEIAAGIAQSWGWTVEPHPADWQDHGRSAGPRRNRDMVALGAEMLIALPGPDSVGTWDCVKAAVRAGIPAYVYALLPAVPRLTVPSEPTPGGRHE